MENVISKARDKRSLMVSHMVIYVAVILYACTYFFQNDLTGFQLVRSIAIIAVFLIFIIFNNLIVRSKKQGEQKAVTRIIFYSVRMAAAAAMYFTASSEYDNMISLALIIFFTLECIIFVALASFDDMEKRYLCYGAFILVYGLVTMIQYISILYAKQMEVGDFLRRSSIVFIVVFMVLGLGESLAACWNYFEKRMFAQNRAITDLDEANEALQEQQEKIEQINEKLGTQKVELQAANKKINRSHDEMSVQNEISSNIASTLDKEVMLNHVAKILQVRLDLDMVVIVLEEDNSLLVPGEEPHGRFAAISTSLGREFEDGIMDSVKNTDLKELLTLSKTYIQNTDTETIKFFRRVSSDKSLPSMICLPITKQGERLGTLVIARAKENAFMDGKTFYESIASQLSIGISNARLYEKMNDMAIRDGLTRIYNRRHLSELLDEYLAEGMRRKVPVSLALFDIDKFKMVNDTYGHQCGDEVIRYVATMLNRGALMHGGIAGRYGGEEFVIAFLNKSLDETYEIVKDVHEQIRSEKVVFEDKEIRVTASAGVASYPKTCSNPSELLTRADWAMYHSKRNGRNQITIDSDKIIDSMD